jgi:hypothetical protein
MVAGNSASKGRIKSTIAAKIIVTASEAANVMRGPVAVFLLNCLAQLDEHRFAVGARRALEGTVRTILESNHYLISPVLRCDIRERDLWSLRVTPESGRSRLEMKLSATCLV